MVFKRIQFIQIPTILDMLKERTSQIQKYQVSQILAGEEISTQTINKMSSIKLNINKTESIINSQFGRNL